jgi:hypothetical protein
VDSAAPLRSAQNDGFYEDFSVKRRVRYGGI